MTAPDPEPDAPRSTVNYTFHVDAQPDLNTARRTAALRASLSYHETEEELPSAEEVVSTAIVFEYYLEHGEYPTG